MKEQDKIPGQQLSDVEIGDLPEEKFRAMTINMTQDFGKRVEAQTEKVQKMLNEELKDLKNKQKEMNNTIPEMKKYTGRNQHQSK